MARRPFIVFEGGEGAGKSTQARLLADWLRARRIPHVLTREPGGTALGEQVRAVLLDGGPVPARAELFLMLAARVALLEATIVPALEAGKLVIADRYDLSTFAYQGGGRGLPLEEVRRLNSFATLGLKPDMTLLLQVAPSASAERRARDGRAADRIEREGPAFHQRVGAAYALLARTEPGVTVVDATAGIDEVHRRILGLLRGRFPETFGGAAG